MQGSLYFRCAEIFLRPLHHVDLAGVWPSALAQHPDGWPRALCGWDLGAHFHVAVGLHVGHRFQASRGDAVASFVRHDAQRAVLDIGVVKGVGVGLSLAIAPAVTVGAFARLEQPFAGIGCGFAGVAGRRQFTAKLVAESQGVARGHRRRSLVGNVQWGRTWAGFGIAQRVKVIGLRRELGGAQVKEDIEHVVVDARLESGRAHITARAAVGNEAAGGRAQIKVQVFPARLGGAGLHCHPVVVFGVAAGRRVANFQAYLGARLRRVHPHAQLGGGRKIKWIERAQSTDLAGGQGHTRIGGTAAGRFYKA